jgi:hypothetical protein
VHLIRFDLVDMPMVFLSATRFFLVVMRIFFYAAMCIFFLLLLTCGDNLEGKSIFFRISMADSLR